MPYGQHADLYNNIYELFVYTLQCARVVANSVQTLLILFISIEMLQTDLKHSNHGFRFTLEKNHRVYAAYCFHLCLFLFKNKY